MRRTRGTRAGYSSDLDVLLVLVYRYFYLIFIIQLLKFIVAMNTDNV